MKRKPDGYWSESNVLKHILKHKTLKDIRTNEYALYVIIIKLKLQRLIPLSFYTTKLPHSYWTLDKLTQEAKKYRSRKDFEIGSPKAHHIAHKRGIIDDVCAHMIPQATPGHRLAYAIKFDNKSVYVGITQNLKNRMCHHKTGHLKHLISKLKYEVESTDCIYSIKEIGKIESEMISYFRLNGWNILNKNKAGGMGKIKST